MQVAIVGSGLSGLACAHALIRRGVRPIIIDAGMTLDAGLETVVRRMQSVAPSEWQHADLERVTRNDTLTKRGIPRKFVFGSDYIYARDHPQAGYSGDHIKASTTLAKGGFGAAWGAAILPATQEDMAGDWPLSKMDLEPSYKAVMSWLPLSAQEDGLSVEFPTYKDGFVPLGLPKQAVSLLHDLEQARLPGLCFGQAHLAVHTDGARACRYCGLCLSGCVYGSIFNPADELDRLAREGKLSYEPGWLAHKISPEDGKVTLALRRLGSGEGEDRVFDRVFVAAGAINTTRIMLRSLKLYDYPVQLADSQKFLLPLFRREAVSYDVSNINSLAALFMELRLPELDNNLMHIQVSTVNDFVLRRLRIDRSSFIRMLLSPVLKRSLMAWCSLHSQHSARLVATLKPDRAGDQLELTETHLERARDSVQAAARHLSRIAPRFKSFIFPRLVNLSPTGAGNHIGGSLPMRAQPKDRLDTDILGRPQGWHRVHVVDSAVLPTVPATTIALLTMANADRIATEVALD